MTKQMPAVHRIRVANGLTRALAMATASSRLEWCSQFARTRTICNSGTERLALFSVAACVVSIAVPLEPEPALAESTCGNGVWRLCSELPILTAEPAGSLVAARPVVSAPHMRTIRTYANYEQVYPPGRQPGPGHTRWCSSGRL